ncbi:MAG: DNA recombination protein RmuC [Endomicrobia bacterium]|nr:DNA recombination protein RmuC [Endomicrobiia bacterium]
MNTIIIIVLVCIIIILLFLLFLKKSGSYLEQRIISKFEEIEKLQQRTETMLKDEISRNKQETNSIISVQLTSVLQTTQQQIEILRQTVEKQLQYIQQESSRKLDQMREIVDEKLQSTLETKLGNAFKQVSERLEVLHQNLGEMQSLANAVGDLKKVLANVKTKGIFGEIQLKNILEDILTSEQYLQDVRIKEDTKEQVEFAIKIPSKSEDNKYVLLPIDAKFPTTDYEKIIEAQENGNLELFKEAVDSLKKRIIQQSKDIKEKYIIPPKTTDFAIMFLPIEGLFAEVLRIPGLFEKIRKEYNVIVTGPTTITAIIGSLQMGFRTLAVEKRASEVWKLLGEVKIEFIKFSDLLDKTYRKIKEASDTIEDATKKTKTIQTKLKEVETLPQENQAVLNINQDK